MRSDTVEFSAQHACSVHTDGAKRSHTNVACLYALNELEGALELTEMNAREVDSSLRNTFKIEGPMLAVGRFMGKVAKLEGHGQTGREMATIGSRRRLVSNLTIRGIPPRSFRERITGQLRFEATDSSYPGVVQGTIALFASMILKAVRRRRERWILSVALSATSKGLLPLAQSYPLTRTRESKCLDESPSPS